MLQEVLDYINSKKICVVGIEMMDGAPHGATLHFAHTEDPLTFIFCTDRNSRKAEPLFGCDTSRATLVIGFEEGAGQATFQADGTARLLTEKDAQLKEIYLNKFEKKRKAILEDEDSIFFCFTPTWWRYTTWKPEEGKKVMLSTD